jgi:hypothetical protein
LPSGLNADVQSELLSALDNVFLKGKLGALDKASKTRTFIVQSAFSQTSNPACAGDDRTCAPNAPIGWTPVSLYEGTSSNAPPNCAGVDLFDANQGLVAPPATCSSPGATPALPPISWQVAARGCSVESSTGTCAEGSTCVARTRAPFVASACIWRAGDLPCPAAFANHHLYYQGFQDTRVLPTSCEQAPSGDAFPQSPVSVCCAQ